MTSHSPQNTLVLAAAAFELEALGAGPWSSRVVGVGVVEAALGLGEPSPPPPDEVWMVGSAGAYPGSGLEIGEVVTVTSYRFALAAVEQGRAYLPEPQPIVAAPPAPRRALPELRRVSSVTTASITRAPRDAAALGRLGQIEHLELFAAARWAERLGIPFGALLAISNEVGPHAHEQWLRWHRPSERAAGQALRALLLNSDRARDA